MSKIEIVKSLTEQKTKPITEQMEELKKLQKEIIPEFATQIEPMAQSMAALADDLQLKMDGINVRSKEMHQESLKQAKQWSQEQKEAAKAWERSAHEIIGARNAITYAKTDIYRMASRWRTWLLAVIIGVSVGVAAPSAYVIWQNQFFQIQKKAKRWDQTVEKLKALSTSDKEIVMKKMGWYLEKE